MNEYDEDSDPLYHFKVKNYLKNKEIFGNNFMSVDGANQNIKYIEIYKKGG